MGAGYEPINRVKDGAPTVRVIVVVAVNEPDVPVIVIGYCPAGTLLAALNVIRLLEVVGFDWKVAVTPEGSPDADRVTAPLKPYES